MPSCSVPRWRWASHAPTRTQTCQHEGDDASSPPARRPRCTAAPPSHQPFPLPSVSALPPSASSSLHCHPHPARHDATTRRVNWATARPAPPAAATAGLTSLPPLRRAGRPRPALTREEGVRGGGRQPHRCGGGFGSAAAPVGRRPRCPLPAPASGLPPVLAWRRLWRAPLAGTLSRSRPPSHCTPFRAYGLVTPLFSAARLRWSRGAPPLG